MSCQSVLIVSEIPVVQAESSQPRLPQPCARGDSHPQPPPQGKPDKRTLVYLMLLGTLIACTSADCEACVDGHCFSRKTLIHGFHVSDRLAIDNTNNVLYVQLNSNLSTAFFLDDLQIHLIQTLNTTDIAFDQDKQVLYIAGANQTIYKYIHDSNKMEMVLDHPETKDVDLIFYKNMLYFTSKTNKGLFFIGDVERYLTYLVNFTITDFVVTKDDIYFVADENVYFYNRSSFQSTKLVSGKKLSLSLDKNDNVYVGDAEVNAIYKLNELRELVDYAAYKTGSVDSFVFDISNNIVFHDKLSGDVVSWKPQFQKCSIQAPHIKYSIKEIPDNSTEEFADYILEPL